MIEQDIVSMSLQKAIEANKLIIANKPLKACHDLYDECCEMAEHISYHAVKGVFPKKLFANRSPNETEKEAKYIKENYKQHTLPVFIDYQSTITRPFGDGNWSINYLEDEAAFKLANQTFQDYVEGNLPIYGSLENFVKFILPSIKSIDANGFIAVRPKEIEYINGEDGQPVISDQLYSPTIYYFNSENVIDYKSNEYYLFLSKEKSIVTFAGKKQETGSIFELYTKDAVIFIKQIGVKNDNKFEVIEFYRHNLGDCFTHQLMGVPNLKGDSILWQSPFLYSTDLLDLVTMNANWLQASINKCVYPHVVMFGSPCEFRDSDGNNCDGGYIHIEGLRKTCTSCNGSGLKSRLSPLGTMLLNPTTKFENGEEKSTQDPLRFISPDVTTLEFISKKIEDDTNKARSILHLQTSSKVSGTPNPTNPTATGQVLDNKAMYSFVKPISDQIFTLYEFCLNAIGVQRYGESHKPPELSYPKTFDFKSPEDYLKDITNAITNNLPPSFIQMVLMQYIQSFYGDNNKSTQIFKLIVNADRLFGLSNDEINMQLARGTASKWEQTLHTSILIFITEQDEAFLAKDVAIQAALLQDIAKAKQAEIEGKPLTDIYQTNENILAQSVGGLTGMIEIVKAVASGLYDLEAAVSLVAQRFGISEEEARKQIGTPQVISKNTDITNIVALT